MHAVVLLLATVALLLACRMAYRQSDWKSALGLGAVIGLSLWFSYLSAQFILAVAGLLGLHIAVRLLNPTERPEGWRLLRHSALAGAVSLLIFLPWISAALGVALRLYVQPALPAPGPAVFVSRPYETQVNLHYALEILSEFGGWHPFAAIASLVLAVAGLIGMARLNRRLLFIPLCWFLAPLAIFLFTHAGHFFPPRYMLYILSVYALLVGCGAATAGQALAWLARWPRPACLAPAAALLALAPCLLPILISFPRTHGEENQNWRAAVRFIELSMQDGDTLVLGDHMTDAGVMLYLSPDLAGKRLNLVTNALSFQQFKQAITMSPNTWFIHWASLPPELQDFLDRHMSEVRRYQGRLGIIHIHHRKQAG